MPLSLHQSQHLTEQDKGTVQEAHCPSPYAPAKQDVPPRTAFPPIQQQKGTAIQQPRCQAGSTDKACFWKGKFSPDEGGPKGCPGCSWGAAEAMLCPLAQSKHPMARGCCQNRAEAPDIFHWRFCSLWKPFKDHLDQNLLCFHVLLPQPWLMAVWLWPKQNLCFKNSMGTQLHLSITSCVTAHQHKEGTSTAFSAFCTFLEKTDTAVRDMFSLDRPWRPLSTVSRASPGNLAGSPLVLYSKCPLFLPSFSFPSPFSFSFSLSLSHFLSCFLFFSSPFTVKL